MIFIQNIDAVYQLLKRICFYFLFSMIFIACNTERRGADLQTSMSYLEELDSVIQMRIMEAHEKQDEIEFRCFQNAFVPLMSKKHYSFNCINGCDGEGQNTNLELENGIEITYDKKSRFISNDSVLLYSFSYITDCEMRFAGDVERRNDTLYLVLIDFRFPVVRCYCKYSFQFEIKKSPEKFSHVFVKRIKSEPDY